MTLTQWIIIWFTATILLTDVVIILVKGSDYTISVTITAWSKKYPFIPFAFGVLMGHFFAQNC